MISSSDVWTTESEHIPRIMLVGTYCRKGSLRKHKNQGRDRSVCSAGHDRCSLAVTWHCRILAEAFSHDGFAQLITGVLIHKVKHGCMLAFAGTVCIPQIRLTLKHGKRIVLSTYIYTAPFVMTVVCFPSAPWCLSMVHTDLQA